MRNLLLNFIFVSASVCSFDLFSETLSEKTPPNLPAEIPTEILTKKTKAVRLEDSLTYFRVGGFSFLYVPIGVEASIGHRFRTENWGWGPLLNISISPFTLPAASLKIEGLYYPSSWKGGYFGLMPGIGIANVLAFHSQTPPSSTTKIWANIEIVAGKEFINKNNKKTILVPIG